MSILRPPDWKTVYQWQRRAAISAVVAAISWMLTAVLLVTR